MNIISSILPFVIAITILVFIHEYGHFWVARRNGVKVDVFSIGFGPELFGWTDKHQTRWRISPLPFGGYVKFAGDADVSSSTTDATAVAAMTDEERSQTLASKTPLQRIAVSFAGPAANYIFAIFALAVCVYVQGIPQKSILEIRTAKAEMNGAVAGLRAGDIITAINDKTVANTTEIVKALSEAAGTDVDLTVSRMAVDQRETLHIKAPLYTMKDGHKTNAKLGIEFSEKVTEYQTVSLVRAVGHSVHYCLTLSWGMLTGIGRMIIGHGGEMGGIGTIGEMAKNAMDSGILNFVNFLILLSVNLGLVNLLPVPVLDGGNILLTTIEWLRGKPLAQKMQERLFQVGLLLVGGLMLYTTGSDIWRFCQAKFMKAPVEVHSTVQGADASKN